MVSWCPTTVTEETNLAVYEAAGPTNTKKTTKFGLAVFTNTVLLCLAVRLSVKTDIKLFVYNNYCNLQQLWQSNSSVIV